MRSISVTMNISLDGVVQGPARPDEDTRGGFTHGGWGAWHQDEVLAREMAKGMSGAGDSCSAAVPGRTSSPCGRTARTATRTPPA